VLLFLHRTWTKSLHVSSNVYTSSLLFNAPLKSLLLKFLKNVRDILLHVRVKCTLYISLKRCDSKIECAFFEDECSERAGCLKKPKVCDLFKKRQVCWLEFSILWFKNRYFVHMNFQLKRFDPARNTPKHDTSYKHLFWS